jgi:hypothetical protein
MHLSNPKLLETPSILKPPIKLIRLISYIRLLYQSMHPRGYCSIEFFTPRLRRFLHHFVAVVDGVVEGLGVVDDG